MKRKWKNCWNRSCRWRSGYCNWCGKGAACCRKGVKGGGCDGRIGGNRYHACVEVPTGYLKCRRRRRRLFDNINENSARTSLGAFSVPQLQQLLLGQETDAVQTPVTGMEFRFPSRSEYNRKIGASTWWCGNIFSSPTSTFDCAQNKQVCLSIDHEDK